MKKYIDPIDVEIGRELRDIRKQRGMTLLEVANRLRCHKSLISHYELGKTSISVQQLIRLCEIYDVEYTDVLERVRKIIYSAKV